MYHENVLEDLYYGCINPEENCFEYDADYAAFIKIIADNGERLSEFLEGLSDTEKQQHQFSQLINAYNTVLQFSEHERFIEGFRFGAKFMLDTFLIPQQTAR